MPQNNTNSECITIKSNSVAHYIYACLYSTCFFAKPTYPQEDPVASGLLGIAEALNLLAASPLSCRRDEDKLSTLKTRSIQGAGPAIFCSSGVRLRGGVVQQYLQVDLGHNKWT